MSEQQTPFYNKIFFCDVVGYSRLSPLGQYACQRSLNRAISGVLTNLGTELEADVIALPTGDGLILNYIAADPDLHLRTALGVLEGLHRENGADEAAFELRIGLNSAVDMWVHDINGKRNVVGSGVNMAQRIMDLAGHGQILMHERVRDDLGSYQQYGGKLQSLGSTVVKHGAQLPIVQYHDPDCAFLSPELATLRTMLSPGFVSLSEIRQEKSGDALMRIGLSRHDFAGLGELQGYIEDRLDESSETQHLKVTAAWIALEMLNNAFVHGLSVADGSVELSIFKNASGLRIVVSQPDSAAFGQLPVSAEDLEEGSFLHLMRRAGVTVSSHREAGRFVVAAQLAHALQVRPMPLLKLAPEAATVADLPTPFLAYMDGIVDEFVADRTMIARPDLVRVDDSSAREFADWLMAAVGRVERGGTLVVDLEHITYLSSRGLRALSLGQREANSKSARIVLSAANETIREVLAISRYDRVLPVCENALTAYRMATEPARARPQG